VVDFYDDLLRELRKSFHTPNMIFIKNKRYRFSRRASEFGRLYFQFWDVRPFGCAADRSLPAKHARHIAAERECSAAIFKQAQVMARENTGFSDNTPEKMREMAVKAGFRIVEED